MSRLAIIEYPWNLEMGPRSSIGEHAWVYCLDRIVLDEFAIVGQYCKLITGTHDFRDVTFPLVTRPIRVGYGAWLATASTILPGVAIARLSVVGAGSVISKSTEENCVYAGNPARLVGHRFGSEEQSL